MYGAPAYGPAHPSLTPGWGASIPPAPPPGPKTSHVGIILLAFTGASFLLAAVAAGFFLIFRDTHDAKALPVEAERLPASTTEVATRYIEAARERDPEIRDAYLAAELGAQLCRPGAEDPAHRLESMGRGSPREAKRFFFGEGSLEGARRTLECGGMLAGTLDSPYETAIAFEDEGKERRVAVGHFHFSSLPSSFGFTPHAFGGVPGFCHTEGERSSRDGKVVLGECGETSRGAFARGTTWFLGDRVSLEPMAAAANAPREDLSASVAALKEAASRTDGLSVVRVRANPKSSRDFFMAPCFFGASRSAAPFTEFTKGCFPTESLDRSLREIDARVRAAAFETDADVGEAGEVHGNVLFVARDEHGAKEIMRDVEDVVLAMRTHVESNEAKLIVDSRRHAETAREKKFAAISETYFRALRRMKVERDGRTIRVSYGAPISKSEKRALEDADRSTLETRKAVAQVLSAIRKKQEVPVPALATLVGPSWAAYLAGPAPAAPLVTPKRPMSASECRLVQAKLRSVRLDQLHTSEARVLYFDHKYASCDRRPPVVDEARRSCLLSFHGPAELSACAVSAPRKPAGEPPDSEFGVQRR